MNNWYRNKWLLPKSNYGILVGKYIIGKKTYIAEKIYTLDWKGKFTCKKKNNQGFGGANLIPFRLQSF